MKKVSILFASIFISLTCYANVSISFDVNDENILKFKESQTGEPILQEFSGDLSVTDEKIFYFRKDNEIVQVGEFKSGDLKLCLDEYESVCSVSISAKYPDSELVWEHKTKNIGPIYTMNLELKSEKSPYRSYTELEKYVVPTPTIKEEGASLHFSVTSAAEIILALKTGLSADLTDMNLVHGNTDLSKRFLMQKSQDFKTDLGSQVTNLIYAFNLTQSALLEDAYPITKGFYKIKNDKYILQDANAYFGTGANWVNSSATVDLKDVTKFAKLPILDRTILSENKDTLSAGVLNRDIVEKIKKEIRENSPVVVVYNHFGYTHSALIVGYDDEKYSNGCAIVSRWVEYMNEKRPEQKLYLDSVKTSIEQNGGCLEKGVFHVKDTIYYGSDKKYDYNTKIDGEEDFYAKKIIEHPYDLVTYLANNVYSVHPLK